MDSALQRLAEQWPLLAFVLATTVAAVGWLARWYLRREARRERSETERKVEEEKERRKERAEREEERRQDKEDCRVRLRELEDRHAKTMAECVMKAAEASTAQAETNRLVAACLDRVCKAVAERPDMRDPAEIAPQATDALEERRRHPR